MMVEMNEIGNEAGISQAANSPQQNPAQAQPQIQSAQPDGSNRPAARINRAKLIVPTVIVLIVLVGIVFYSLQYFAQINNHATTTIPTTNASTTIPNTTTSTIATYFDGYNVVLRPYALYGLPDQGALQEYYQYLGDKSAVPAEPFARGAVGGSLSEFGLSFMDAIINGTTELPWNYNQTIPAQYANYSYPVGVIVQVFNFTNSTSAARFMLYALYYNKTINGTPNGPIPRANNTVQVYMPLDGYAFLTNISGYSNASAFYKTTLIYNFTSIDGTPIIMAQNTPLYQHIDQYLIGFQYNTYIVLVTGYGIYGHLNMSYPLATAKYMLHVLRS